MIPGWIPWVSLVLWTPQWSAAYDRRLMAPRAKTAKTSMKIAHAVGVAGVLAVLAATGSATEAADLVSHRALYRTNLAASTNASGIVGAQGTMLYHFAESCDGWTVENRAYLVFQYAEGEAVESTWSFLSWESLDGRQYRFRVRHDRDRETVDAFKGDAELSDGERSGIGRFRGETEQVRHLPPGTQFPTDHLRFLIDAAEGGTKHVTRVVFDGANLDNPYEISAFMTEVPFEDRAAASKVTGLADAPAWNMRLAFFKADATSPHPEFEIAARYRVDGIADRVLQEFRDFSLDHELETLEVLPAPDC